MKTNGDESNLPAVCLSDRDPEEMDDFISPGKSWMLGPLLEDEPYDETEALEKVGNRTYMIVVIYDIVENKKRTALAKALLGYGERVQRSAFECHLTLRQYERLLSDILPLIDETEDLLRIYRLPGAPQVEVWGHVPETFQEDFIII